MEYQTHELRPIGSTFHYQKRKYHIIGICEEFDHKTGYKMIIYLVKFFGKYKQWWHYEAMTAEEYDWHLESGALKEDRK